MIRKHLWIGNLLKDVKSKFNEIKDVAKRKRKYSLTDCLMSGLALFGMKYPSLLKFDTDTRSNKTVMNNIKNLYSISEVPSDTTFRETLDEVEPKKLQNILDFIISKLQRGKVLEKYRHINNKYLIPLDGTGYFSSHNVHCDNCCVKEHRDGTKTYYHNALTCVIAHPQQKEVFPLALEPIIQQDGTNKNDCELNAAKRIVETLQNSHPHLSKILVCDALYSNGPFIKNLLENDISYIITVTGNGNKFLFDKFKLSSKEEIMHEGDKTYKYKYTNQIQLNASHPDLLVNIIDYTELKNDTVIYHSTWITDITITKENLQQIMEGARTRWHIENQTFNTLKNQGYHFEHNFGHGNNNLTTVLAYLMLITFLIDQVQSATSDYFKKALEIEGRNSYLWGKIKTSFKEIIFDCWKSLYEHIINPKLYYCYTVNTC